MYAQTFNVSVDEVDDKDTSALLMIKSVTGIVMFDIYSNQIEMLPRLWNNFSPVYFNKIMFSLLMLNIHMLV